MTPQGIGEKKNLQKMRKYLKSGMIWYDIMIWYDMIYVKDGNKESTEA